MAPHKGRLHTDTGANIRYKKFLPLHPLSLSISVSKLLYWSPQPPKEPPFLLSFFNLGSSSSPLELLTKMENPSRAEAFPVGLRVLVVDDDPTWLKILEKMLRKCSYEGSLAQSLMGFNLFLDLVLFFLDWVC